MAKAREHRQEIERISATALEGTCEQPTSCLFLLVPSRRSASLFQNSERHFFQTNVFVSHIYLSDSRRLAARTEACLAASALAQRHAFTFSTTQAEEHTEGTVLFCFVLFVASLRQNV